MIERSVPAPAFYHFIMTSIYMSTQEHSVTEASNWQTHSFKETFHNIITETKKRNYRTTTDSIREKYAHANPSLFIRCVAQSLKQRGAPRERSFPTTTTAAEEIISMKKMAEFISL